jgi:hypothetical protein
VAVQLGSEGRHGVETAIAKLMATEYCTEITLAAQKVMGAYGYASEFPMERYVRDSLALPIFGGSSAIQRNLLATTPIRRINTPRHLPVKAGMRPIDHARHVTMLYRIPVDVIHVARIVGVITNAVFPKPPLPDAAFPTLEPTCRTPLAGLDGP